MNKADKATERAKAYRKQISTPTITDEGLLQIAETSFHCGYMQACIDHNEENSIVPIDSSPA